MYGTIEEIGKCKQFLLQQYFFLLLLLFVFKFAICSASSFAKNMYLYSNMLLLIFFFISLFISSLICVCVYRERDREKYILLYLCVFAAYQPLSHTHCFVLSLFLLLRIHLVVNRADENLFNEKNNESKYSIFLLLLSKKRVLASGE